MIRVLIAAALLGLLAAAVHPGAGITVGPDGLIYFADPIRNVVWRLEDDGSLTKIFEDVHTNVLFITDDGTPYFPPGGYGPDGLYYLMSAPDGTGYGTIRSIVVRIDSAGHFQTLAGDTVAGFRDGPAAQARFDRPQGIAIDSAGAIYVADHGNRRVRVITADGMVETVARGRWPWTPTGVAVRGDEVFVIERLGKYWGFPILEMGLRRLMDHPRLSVIRPDGSFELVVAVPTEKEPARTMIIGVLVIALAAGLLLAYGRFADRKIKSHTST